MRITNLIILIIALCISSHASAALFGNDEELHKIQDIEYNDGSGDKYFLGYKTKTLFVLAGVSISDEGYVLGVEGSRRYIPLDKKTISDFQEDGVLPSPLPKYSIAVFDYIIGFSLWLLLIFYFFPYGYIGKLFTKK